MTPLPYGFTATLSVIVVFCLISYAQAPKIEDESAALYQADPSSYQSWPDN
jgi:hypothetical protein